MKKRRYTVTLIVLFYSCLSFAQFNTLRATVPKKSENPKVSEKSTMVEGIKQKKNKRSWKEVLNITTKSDLKNETEGSTKWLTSQIDSLKMLIKEYSSVKELRRNEFEKLKDSLMLQAENRVEVTKQTSKKQELSTTYDFVDEPKDFFSKIVMPVKNKITVTSSYGTRTHPIFGTRKTHNGIDLKASFENVYSVLDGIVTATGWDSKGGGNFIKVKHFDRFETSYLHLSEIYYRAGEKVKAGFIIGKSGNSGNSTGPHLHFSVKEFGQNINPSHFLNDLIKVNNLIANHYEH
ncbi:M23 family metallopeptidase [Epilithonimonas ginsengisoli]|uniref:M23 family metallopeptidase n=1 Tax=Epilithonimonas ginsengisoli TaxID=1245592 RepID=A0ABU4JLP3_9FLAO|nr:MULTISPECIES: M23 family metallopeptidase [Chryseobacterium group]MBV6881486.1 M23 family metallopeptidase [Epilithonimonas sp. FP105]MDW8550458.1 M23 family metallopeptidase [Epilithonimonas ginsengisoli]OAH72693.1 metallopeptidase [Chryseobacterium sp. FP211-J200]HBV17461.1 M23 family peptidase [Chryseobacterium carnipullorum]